MLSEAEIQRAHDILIAVKLGEVMVLVPDDDSLTAAIDVLCWVLRHDHNQTFAENLAGLEAAIAATGAVLHDAGRAVAREDLD
jgi:hypothetical protein